MKCRSGFVSNSSSSSFICDTEMSTKEVIEKMEELKEFYTNFFSNNTNPRAYRCDYIVFRANKHYGDGRKNKIIIESDGDNAISWELFDIIERKFNARRCHLG